MASKCTRWLGLPLLPAPYISPDGLPTLCLQFHVRIVTEDPSRRPARPCGLAKMGAVWAASGPKLVATAPKYFKNRHESGIRRRAPGLAVGTGS